MHSQFKEKVSHVRCNNCNKTHLLCPARGTGTTHQAINPALSAALCSWVTDAWARPYTSVRGQYWGVASHTTPVSGEAVRASSWSCTGMPGYGWNPTRRRWTRRRARCSAWSRLAVHRAGHMNQSFDSAARQVAAHRRVPLLDRPPLQMRPPWGKPSISARATFQIHGVLVVNSIVLMMRFGRIRCFLLDETPNSDSRVATIVWEIKACEFSCGFSLVSAPNASRNRGDCSLIQL